jgi:GGDEF domain-containing protein
MNVSAEQAQLLPRAQQPPGMRSRNELLADLERAADGSDAPKRLVILGLDGFREFVETHGRLEGDELLFELSGRLEQVATSTGTCYWPRHDEFAFLCDADLPELDPLLDRAVASLSERSSQRPIVAALGAALVPAEAASPIEALRLADGRLSAVQPERRTRDRRRVPRPGSDRSEGAEEQGGGSDSLQAIRAEIVEASSSARRVHQVDQLLNVAETLTTLADAARIDDHGNGRLQGMPREPARIPLLLKELAVKLAALRALDGPEIGEATRLVEGPAPTISTLSVKVLSALDAVGAALEAA